MNTDIEIRTGAWKFEDRLRLSFPENWVIRHIKGNFLPAARPEEIQTPLENPIGSERLHRILERKRSVAIVVDDHTRPTPVFRIVKKVLNEIRLAGIPECNVKIIVALGTHVLKDKSLMRSKLGGLLDSGIQLVLPDCRNSKDYIYVGKSKSNIPVFIHREYASADAKISISGIYPHDEAGFSGGAKILIGVLGLRTLSLFHRKFTESGRGREIETLFRNEVESFADLTGIDFSVNVVVNQEKEVHKVWCGNFRTAFREAAIYAKRCLGVDLAPDADVVISNAYPFDTSLSVVGKSEWPFKYARKNAKRIVVASPSSLVDFRIPRCASKGEVLRQAAKKVSFVRSIRGALSRLKLRKLAMEFERRPDLKWEGHYVFFMPRFEMVASTRLKVTTFLAVYDVWDSLLGELKSYFPDCYNVNVALYDFAPMHYPLAGSDC